MQELHSDGSRSIKKATTMYKVNEYFFLMLYRLSPSNEAVLAGN